MITFTKNSWEVSGNLAEIKRMAYSGKISQAVWLLCWQVSVYGDDYLSVLTGLGKSENLDRALALLAK